MSKGAVIVAIGAGAVILLGGVAYAYAADAKTVPPPLVPGAPPPPPPSLNQTVYATGYAAAKIGESAYEKATGSKLTTKEIAYNVATGGIYGNAKAAYHWASKIF